MSKIVIYVITILGLLLYSNSIENKRIPMNQIFHSVTEAYQDLLQSTTGIGKFLVETAIGTGIAVIAVFSYQRSQLLLNNSSQERIFLLMIFILTILLIAFYFAFGLPLLIFSKIERLIKTIHKRKLCFSFLVTSYILFGYSYFLWYEKAVMESCGKVVLIGLLVSYILNMNMLIHISMEPVSCCLCRFGQKKKVEQKYPLKVVLAGALILMMLIVLNLFLGVVMISNLFEDAYLNIATATPVTSIDLLYYTVISFTTIGYGEIVPQRLESKVMAILIAGTSVMCLVIFVSAILALKDKLSG